MKWILVSCCIAMAVATPAGLSGGGPVTTDEGGIIEEEIPDQSVDHVVPDWIKIAGFDLTKGNSCPSPWKKVTINKTDMCRSPSGSLGCSSVIFPVNGRKYRKIRDMVREYQKGSTDAFNPYQYQRLGINTAYVDGVSITLASSPRKHVWTYASGLSSDSHYTYFNCPCSAVPGPNPPSFVGEHYYCESGNQGSYSYDTYHTKKPLWDQEAVVPLMIIVVLMPTHHGSIENFSQHKEKILKSGSALIKHLLMKVS